MRVIISAQQPLSPALVWTGKLALKSHIVKGFRYSNVALLVNRYLGFWQDEVGLQGQVTVLLRRLPPLSLFCFRRPFWWRGYGELMSRIIPLDVDSKKWVSRWHELMHPRIRRPDGGWIASIVVSVIASLGLSVALKSSSMMWSCLFPSRLWLRRSCSFLGSSSLSGRGCIRWVCVSLSWRISCQAGRLWSLAGRWYFVVSWASRSAILSYSWSPWSASCGSFPRLLV